ncbi:hypothetical protein PF010_g25325 [Phytophthora fragariae]|uniref:Uncharacterized protein n=1 Tax=Phytophthora fragariae TaxID=53985 RepID=A0A6A3YCY8_9STRA|nr:hypothetical protein PF009_g24048 [Phytophthora fragariae]KAE8980678.1 hypothetical protein PF011_g22337 [Phytophthora fragariae]KAE9072831.1 hypothetical protein PF010_g25325 [Phytophthora fragariae]KAE9091069.1 hypothetical protein PF006_g25011 [Phytophthora fragariae]KAE9190372.1 hypothetical protein PF004_g21920 [Phytophthora fragariae]
MLEVSLPDHLAQGTRLGSAHLALAGTAKTSAYNDLARFSTRPAATGYAKEGAFVGTDPVRRPSELVLPLHCGLLYMICVHVFVSMVFTAVRFFAAADTHISKPPSEVPPDPRSKWPPAVDATRRLWWLLLQPSPSGNGRAASRAASRAAIAAARRLLGHCCDPA